MKKMRLLQPSLRLKILPTLPSGTGTLQRCARRRWVLDYVHPTDLLNDATKVASRKASLSVRDLLIRSFLAGGLLAYATSLVFIVLSQNVAPIVGAILFPVGFVILVLLGLELATGNFALLPIGWAAGEVSFLRMLRNLGWVYLGNFAGSLFYALLFYLAVTNCGTFSAPNTRIFGSL